MPQAGAPFPFDWLRIIFNMAVFHANPSVRKTMASIILADKGAAHTHFTYSSSPMTCPHIPPTPLTHTPSRLSHNLPT